ncbi:MAG: 50S ribosomal protein L5 [Deltaproteobacteria bacterium]|nr:50S ribosomal protein L5 [Deltaproteobacteria bacterium]
MAGTQLETKFQQDVMPALRKELGIANVYRVPRLSKVVVNAGLKLAVQDSKVIDTAMRDITAITGQRPTITKAKKAISNFKLRKGLPIGVRVTLRRNQMYDFVQRLIGVALPRVRDFKGVSATGFDGHGNYTLGITEHVVFPEVDVNKMQHSYGMNVTFVTTARTDQEGRRLLELLGMPFRQSTQD